MAEKSVGVIGLTYENRKNHKIGVLESIEEKYKTLLMRDKDGNTFNITFSTFKSNWRKYQGDDVIMTSAQSTEANQKIEEKAKVAKERLSEKQEISEAAKKDRRMPLFNSGQRATICEDFRVIMQKELGDRDLSDFETKFIKNKGISVVNKHRVQIEVWPIYTSNPIEKVRLRMRGNVWEEVVFDKKVGDVEADFIERDILQYRALIPVESFATAFGNVLDAYIKVTSTEAEKPKKGKKKAVKEDE